MFSESTGNGYRAVVEVHGQTIWMTQSSADVFWCGTMSAFDMQPWFKSLFVDHPNFLPPYSPFINPIEEVFSVWRLKVPYVRTPPLQEMEEVCDDSDMGAVQRWI